MSRGSSALPLACQPAGGYHALGRLFHPHMEKSRPLSALCLFRDVLRCPYFALTVDYKCVFA